MNKKTRLIPFDYEKYKNGAKAVFRNYEAEIINIYPSGGDVYPYLYLCKIHDYYQADGITKNGIFNEDTVGSQDVLLEVEIEEKTFYLNLYPKNVNLHQDLETSKECRGVDCIGTLKVTYTEEDLIK